jgi:hypothetical protein
MVTQILDIPRPGPGNAPRSLPFGLLKELPRS